MSVTCPSTKPAVPVFNRPLFTRPVEVVVMIVSHIEEHCDLLSLAQASEVFHSIIVPSWLDFIHIRWSTCKAIPDCDNFENCNSITSFPSIIPSFSPPSFNSLDKREVYEECVLALADAVKHMTRLRCFRWGSKLPVGYAFESLFKSLGQRNNMDEFYFDLGNQNLREFLFKEKITVPVNLPPISPNSQMMMPHWATTSTTCEESPFTTFLHKHQTIEHLQIRTLNNYSGFIQPQTLSRLRSLVLGFKSHVGPFGNGFPLDIAQQIEYLECSISEECLPTLQVMTSLCVFNALRMDLEVFKRFVEAAPHIQHLQIPYVIWYDSSLLNQLVSCLFKLNHLVRLEADFVLDEECDLFQTQYLISKIMEHESLVYIDSLTREQWNLALKEATLRERFKIYLPCVPIRT
ncbi:hypothetical protein BU17DRAFT_71572 [Hysterangium stoloniferum]|nr:hypothetical protein BU17DRAFT_71572 [Hysterangium stoloniferum]